MNENILVLKRQDVELSRVLATESGRVVMVLLYEGQTFRLMSQFSAAQKDKAKALCESLAQSRGQRCVLLNQIHTYSVWLEVRQEQPNPPLQTTTPTPPTSAVSLTQACLLIMQAIAEDIGDLMGANQKTAFQEDLTKILKQCLIPGSQSSEAINPLLTIAPLSETQLPTWQQKDIEILFPRLGRLGKNYYGNTTFVERTVDALKELPVYTNPRFMYCCMQFALMCKG